MTTPARMTRPLPPRSWIGLAVMIASELGMLARLEPFYSWHTPTAWTGYILFVDGLVWKRRGHSWISDAPAEFAFLAVSSIPLWIIFELYNTFSIQNWHYIGLPESPPLRYFGYAWSFATISPAIFETGDMISSFRRDPPAVGAVQASVSLSWREWTSVAVGAVLLLVPIVYPSPYLAAPIWLGFIFLLDPLNARSGRESILGDLRQGQSRRLVNLLVAGLVCGLIWEFWNYWAGTKWKYTVPIFPEARLFEMPIAGYGGFPPFALECFTMYVFVRRWLWRGASRPISI